MPWKLGTEIGKLEGKSKNIEEILILKYNDYLENNTSCEVGYWKISDN